MFARGMRRAFRVLSAQAEAVTVASAKAGAGRDWQRLVVPVTAAAAVGGTALMTNKPKTTMMASAPKEVIFQLGTNNWQRPKKDGSGLEFAPGSGVLHEAHHNAYNDLGDVKSYSMYPSSTQGQPPGDADYAVFELNHPISICESASPNSSKRWHGMDHAE